MRWATYASVAVASTLIVIKMFAYVLTGSVAILSSLIDSLLDLIASGINLFAVRHALVPADHDHRYGHGKAEAIAGLAQAAFITGSSIFLIVESINRFYHQQPIENGNIGIVVMLITITLTALLVKFQRYVVKQTGSIAITADSLHYVGDLLLNLSVLIALVLGIYFDWQLADPVFALLIAAFILKSAWDIAKQSLAQLMDQELPDELREEIKKIALQHPEVLNMHELRTRSSGRQYFIQLHLEMDGELKLREAHEIANEVEIEICKVFPNAEVIIHEDMEGLHDDESRE
ncbi:MAG: divalent metal cation transporter FieF [Gammaproteobacteria bacterium]|nr:MAG: divalent metal cation transporter FieF [Gammaproteobacteria bacterium]RKZ71544.1 MAG: divalent metal cation transporter FieF [Gammaproteobacteria bacterium]